jgi:hypothetical protein
VNRPEAVSVSSEVVLAGVPDEDRATIAVAIWTPERGGEPGQQQSIETVAPTNKKRINNNSNKR